MIKMLFQTSDKGIFIIWIFFALLIGCVFLMIFAIIEDSKNKKSENSIIIIILAVEIIFIVPLILGLIQDY